MIFPCAGQRSNGNNREDAGAARVSAVMARARISFPVLATNPEDEIICNDDNNVGERTDDVEDEEQQSQLKSPPEVKHERESKLMSSGETKVKSPLQLDLAEDIFGFGINNENRERRERRVSLPSPSPTFLTVSTTTARTEPQRRHSSFFCGSPNTDIDSLYTG